jgi:hypothetical protein
VAIQLNMRELRAPTAFSQTADAAETIGPFGGYHRRVSLSIFSVTIALSLFLNGICIVGVAVRGLDVLLLLVEVVEDCKA